MAEYTWLLLTDGKPYEYLYHDLFVEPTPVPSPQGFLKRLMVEITAESVESCVDTQHTTTSYSKEYFASCLVNGKGWQWHQIVYPEDSQEIIEDIHSHQFPDLELIWKYSWWKLGQAGYAGYRHRFLKVKFAMPAAKASFEKVWYPYFGAFPQFTPIEQ